MIDAENRPVYKIDTDSEKASLYSRASIDLPGNSLMSWSPGIIERCDPKRHMRRQFLSVYFRKIPLLDSVDSITVCTDYLHFVISYEDKVRIVILSVRSLT